MLYIRHVTNNILDSAMPDTLLYLFLCPFYVIISLKLGLERRRIHNEKLVFLFCRCLFQLQFHFWLQLTFENVAKEFFLVTKMERIRLGRLPPPTFHNFRHLLCDHLRTRNNTG